MRTAAPPVGVRQGGAQAAAVRVRRIQPPNRPQLAGLSVVRTAADGKGPTTTPRPPGFARGPSVWGRSVTLHRRELECIDLMSRTPDQVVHTIQLPRLDEEDAAACTTGSLPAQKASCSASTKSRLGRRVPSASLRAGGEPSERSGRLPTGSDHPTTTGVVRGGLR